MMLLRILLGYHKLHLPFGTNSGEQVDSKSRHEGAGRNTLPTLQLGFCPPDVLEIASKKRIFKKNGKTSHQIRLLPQSVFWHVYSQPLVRNQRDI
ncbi:MAG: hypothetical protein RLY14_3215 [Planctomycetota bacterium]|jgi:hypothetical protein